MMPDGFLCLGPIANSICCCAPGGDGNRVQASAGQCGRGRHCRNIAKELPSIGDHN